MPESLRDLIQAKKAEGMTAIQVQKWLRDQGYAIPWVETMKLYNQQGGTR